MKQQYHGEDREQEHTIATYVFRGTGDSIEVQQVSESERLLPAEQLRQPMSSGHNPIGFVHVNMHAPSANGRSILGDNSDIIVYRTSFFVEADGESKENVDLVTCVINYIQGASNGSGLLNASASDVEEGKENLERYFRAPALPEGMTEKDYATLTDRVGHDPGCVAIGGIMRHHMDGCSACTDAENLCPKGRRMMDLLLARATEIDVCAGIESLEDDPI